MSLRRWVGSSIVFAAIVAGILAGCQQPAPSTGGGGGGGDAVAGQATFNQRCASCHTPGQIAGSANRITNNLATVNIAMIGITLSDTEVANLQAFLATQ